MMHFLFSSFILLAAAIKATPIASRTQSTSSGQGPIATLVNGSYYGTHSSTYDQDLFLGIPFAQPPLGQLRFANPQSLNWTWTGALPATNYAYVSQ
jgi:acetylcholinesterase